MKMKLLSVVACAVLVVKADNSRQILNAVFREMYLNATSDSCPTCGDNQIALESVMSESEIKRYRIEMLKQAILDNLGLDKPPVIKNHQWPEQFKMGEFFERFSTPSDYDSDQSVNEKLFLIPKGISCNVEKVLEMEELSLKMNYILPDTIEPKSITSALVWLESAHRKNRNYLDIGPKPFYMELIPCGDQTNEHITTFKGFQSTNGGWIKFDAMPVMGSWLDKKQTCFNITLTMENLFDSDCRNINTEKKPFLTIHYKADNKRNQSRLKRSHDCTKGSSECCRENLHISIDEIGWGKFIVHPPDFEAYYCKGSCRGAITQSATVHNGFIQQLMSTGKDVSSCCSPTKLLPMDFFVKYSNNSIIQTPMANIVVAACGCM